MTPFQYYNGQNLRTSRGPIELPQVNQQVAQMDEISWCIANKASLRVTGEEGLKDIRVVEAVRKAIETGDKVQI